MQRAAAAAAMVTARLDRPPLTAVNAPAASATPGKPGQRQHFLLQRVVDGHGKAPSRFISVIFLRKSGP